MKRFGSIIQRLWSRRRCQTAACPHRLFSTQHHSSVHITCHPGLERCLQQELQLIHTDFSLHKNGVIVHNITQRQLLQCCLQLGCATQILVPLLETPLQCRGFAELERKIQLLPWKDWLLLLLLEDEPQIHVTSYKSRLYHTAAIAERFRNVLSSSSSSSSSSSKGPALQVQLVRDQLQLFLKARPFPLHQRGYRLETGKAPLREDLAYAMLWSALHSQHYYEAVLDPFCGSGTLVLEAAAMMHGLPPGRLHDAPFHGTFLYNDQLWNELKESSRPIRRSTVRVAGSDRDAGAIRMAHANAVRAGVEDLVTLQHCAFSSHPWLYDWNKEGPLLWVSNLPFGKRTTTGRHAGRVPALLPMYQKLVQHLERQTQCTALFLTDNPSLWRRTGGMDGNVVMEFSHGGIPVSVVRVDRS